MAKKRKSKKEQLQARKNKREEKQMMYWAVGITAVLVILSFLYFRSTL